AGTALDGLGGLAVPRTLARTVADAAMLLDALVLGDYPFTVRAPREWASSLEQAAVAASTGPLDIAVLATSPWHSTVDIELDADATAGLELVVSELERRGHRIRRLSPDWPASYPDHFATVWQSA